MTHWTPELLAPAGNLEKLKYAINYGADAVYLGLKKFGLRSAADNFNTNELKEGVAYAKKHNAKVYVVLNAYLHDKELSELPEYLKILEAVKIDAVIVSDLGVIRCVKDNSNIEVHLSTQASCLNVSSALFWKKTGVSRIVLGREVSLLEAKKIKEATGLELEMFIHGSMCMAYSGNCVISNFTQGRDSNRGGCAHSCRFNYSIGPKDINLQSHFLSSKDLNGIRVLKEFIEAGIDSIKVEGRMKNLHYVSTISKVYSEALNYYKTHADFLSQDLFKWELELSKLSHRDYTQASLIKPADQSSIYANREKALKNYLTAGKVLDVVKDEYILVETNSSFSKEDRLELIPFNGDSLDLSLDFITDIYDRELIKTKPNRLVKLAYIKQAQKNNVIRMKL